MTVRMSERDLQTAVIDALVRLAKYLSTHDEMYLMDAYRLLKNAVEGE